MTTIDEITLERYGHGPAAPFYKVVLSKDGTATYSGMFNVAKVGTYKAQIDGEDFRRLGDLVHHARFFEMDSRYPCGEDAPGVKVSVIRAGQKKTVEDGWGSTAPIDLWAIEQAIDGLVDKVDTWKKSS